MTDQTKEDEAVKQLRECCADEDTASIAMDVSSARLLLAELDRLRAENERLKLFEPACYAALWDLRDAARDLNICRSESCERLNREVDRATKVLEGQCPFVKVADQSEKGVKC